MTIKELYNQLADKDFQDPCTGNLFFPAYMYVYDPEKEYEIEAEILDIKERLHRPSNYLDVLVIDIFQEFLAFLKTQKFGKALKLDFFIDNEMKKSDKVDKALKQDAQSAAFYGFIKNKINSHLSKADDYEVAYVFLKGFGAAYPYIRASKFMNNFEKYIEGYKMILFYPGKAEEYYNLFGILNDENLYRAIKLIN